MSTVNYNLRQLKYFVTTVQCASLAEASRKLHIAQPSISTAIKQLEDAFGVQLFIRRHAHAMSLTASGARFYRKAQEFLRNAQTFEQSALADNNIVAGVVEVGCFETIAPLYLPRLLTGFRARWPGIEVRIRDGEQQELVLGLTRGSIDLAILYDLDLNSTIATTPLTDTNQPHVILPEDHPLARHETVSISELAQMPMVLLDVQPSHTYFISLFEEHGLSPQIGFSSPSIEMVRGMVGQGAGFSILVTRPYSPHTYDGLQVKCLALREHVTGSRLVAARLRQSELTKPAQIFVGYCQEALKGN